MFLEDTGEIVRIRITDLRTDLLHGLICSLKKFPCPCNSHTGQIVGKRNARLCLEDLTELERADIVLAGNIIKRDVLPKVLIDIFLCLLGDVFGLCRIGSIDHVDRTLDMA